MKYFKLLVLLFFTTFLATCGGGGDESSISPASAHKNATTALVEPQSGWWWNPAESGTGFSIERQGNQIFMAAYLYETNGAATWYVSGLTRQSSGAYSGAMQRYSGGQTLLGTYKAPAATTSVLANALLSFNTASTGSLTITFADGSPNRTIALERFAFTPPAAIAPSNASFDSGWWWNEAESGRGYFIEVQGSHPFIAGYMFDSTGQPTWYVSAAAWQGTQSLSGALDQYTNGQSLGGSYKPATKVATSAGVTSLNFSNNTTATMMLPNGSSVALKRFIFSTLPTANMAPVANAGFAQNVATGTVVTLDGSASTDANSDPLTYVWTLTAKPTGSATVLSSPTAVKPTFTADLAGTYAASLIVNDSRVNSSIANVTITAATAAPLSQLPDLIITEMVAGSSAQSGTGVSCDVTLTNQGKATAGVSWLGFYLSSDNVITSSDTDTGIGCNMPALAPGESKHCIGNIAVPNVAPGTYYFGAIANAGKSVAESNENNNSLAASSPTLITSPPPSAGSCGASSGITLSITPTALCSSTGGASAVSSTSTSWTWTCYGTSGGAPASCSAGRQTTGPTITSFELLSTPIAKSFSDYAVTVPISSFTTVGNITGYYLAETVPFNWSTDIGSTDSCKGDISPIDPGWMPWKPTSYTFSFSGTHALYAWVKDSQGCVSRSAMATVTIPQQCGSVCYGEICNPLSGVCSQLCSNTCI